MKALRKEKIRSLDEMAIWKYKIPGIILMENAGLGASQIILSKIAKMCSVSILCGKGNNGGDGFVVARHLYNNDIKVKIFFIGSLLDVDAESDAGINLRIVTNMGIEIIEITSEEVFYENKSELFACDYFVDAIFGTGLTRSLSKPFSTIIRELNACGKSIFAIDTPSGLDCDTGEILGEAIHAFCTITFAAAKKGFYIKEGPKLVGEIHIVDISIPKDILAEAFQNV